MPGSFAPTAVRWGVDNRTCALRLVGHGHSLRPENRVPGGDVNPYLAVAAMIAAGLNGIDNELPLEPEFAGNAYADDSARVPHTLRDALELWENSELAAAAFGDEVVEHYAELRPRRARGLRRRGDRLGAAAGLRAALEAPFSLTSSTSRQHPQEASRCPSPPAEYTVVNPATEQPVTAIVPEPARRGDRRRRRPRPPRPRPPGGRSRPATGPGCCARFAAEVDAHVEELAALEVAESGHPIGQARWEAGHVRDVLLYFAGRAGAADRQADPGRRRART